jgi:hypothetical protein
MCYAEGKFISSLRTTGYVLTDHPVLRPIKEQIRIVWKICSLNHGRITRS